MAVVMLLLIGRYGPAGISTSHHMEAVPAFEIVMQLYGIKDSRPTFGCRPRD